jgi:hypothetical protein
LPLFRLLDRIADDSEDIRYRDMLRSRPSRGSGANRRHKQKRFRSHGVGTSSLKHGVPDLRRRLALNA